MNQETRYKYFTTLIKILIGTAASVFILYKLKEGFTNHHFFLIHDKINFLLLLFAFLLVFFNWAIESIKWKFAIHHVLQLTFIKAFLAVISGITISIITPNRIGEIPARVFLLNQTESNKTLIGLTTLSSFFQLLCTLLFGAIGLFYTYSFFESYFSSNFWVYFLITVAIVFILFVAIKKIPSLSLKLNTLKTNFLGNEHHLSISFYVLLFLMSVLRYVVFCVQYILVLMAFGIEINTSTTILLIPVVFLFTSIIPTILLSEIGVRSTIAVFVFGMISTNEIAIIMASLILWTFNIAIPGLIGVFNLKQLKILNR